MHPVPRRPAHGNWIWVAAGVVAVGVLAGTAFHFATAHGCPAPAAAGPRRPVPVARMPEREAAATATPGASAGTHGAAGQRISGLALYYNPGKAVGSCSLGPFPSGGLYVSLPPALYEGGAACGSYLDVRGPGGSVRAEVVDLCPGCDPTTVNLSRAAFERIANPVPGSARITYRQADDPPLPGPIEVRVGASGAGLLAVQVLHHGNPLTSVAVAASPSGNGAAGRRTRWYRLRLSPDDFWALHHRLPAGRLNVRITDDLGHRAILRHIRLTPGATIGTAVWMYQAPAATPAVSRPPSPSTPPTASPSASASARTC